jgi:hypothetical protein
MARPGGRRSARPEVRRLAAALVEGLDEDEIERVLGHVRSGSWTVREACLALWVEALDGERFYPDTTREVEIQVACLIGARMGGERRAGLGARGAAVAGAVAAAPAGPAIPAPVGGHGVRASVEG